MDRDVLDRWLLLVGHASLAVARRPFLTGALQTAALRGPRTPDKSGSPMIGARGGVGGGRAVALLLVAATSALCGCGRAASSAPPAPGRYVGVGVFQASPGWSALRAAPRPSTGVAGPGDDETILAIADTRTGEVRECGVLSGFCIGFNPWTRDLPQGARAPVALDRSGGRGAGAPAAAARP